MSSSKNPSLKDSQVFGAPTENQSLDMSPVANPTVVSCPKDEQLTTRTEFDHVAVYDSKPYLKHITRKIDTRYQIKQKLPEEVFQLQTLVEDTAQALREKLQDLKEKVAGFAFDSLQPLHEISLDTVLEFLQDLKPMTLTLFLTSYVAARTTGERLAIMNCIYEVFGSFWTEDFAGWKSTFITIGVWIFDKIIKQCWSSVRDNLGVNIEYMDTQSIDLDENGLLSKFLGFFGIDRKEFSEKNGFLSILVLMVVLIITGGSLSKIANLSFDKIMKRLNKVSSSIKSLHNIQEFLPKVWENTLAEVGSVLGFHYVSEDDEVKAFAEEIIALKTEAVKLSDIITYQPWKITQDPELLKKMEDQYTQLDKEYSKFMQMKKNMSAAKIVFDELKQTVKKLREYAKKVEHSSATKQEPFILMISGKPGIGKSQFIDTFVKDFCARVGIPATSYTRNAGIKHWDGYCNQSFVVYDDFGAMKLDADHVDIMTFKNPTRTLLPFADLPDKGGQFTSIGAILCTNETEINSSAAVKCSEALMRRFEIKISAVDPNLDAFRELYKIPPYDYKKRTGKEPLIEDESGELVPYYDSTDFTHLTFYHEPHFMSPDEEAREVQYNEILDISISYYNDYKSKYEKSFITKNENSFKTTIEDYEEALENEPIVEIENLMAKFKKPQEKTDEEIAAEKLEDIETATTSSSGTDLSGYSADEQKEARKIKRKKVEYKEILKAEKMAEAVNILKEEAKTRSKRDLKNKKITPLDFAELQYEVSVARDPSYENCKKEWIASYMKDNPNATRGEAKAAFVRSDYFTLQGETVKLEQPFIDMHRHKCPIFLLSGAPGTGKSTIQEHLFKQFPQADFVHGADLVNHVFPPGLAFVEDASINASNFAVFENLVCKVYDAQHAVKGIVATVNPEIMAQYFATPEHKDRFMRRCHVVRFLYGIKKKKMFGGNEFYKPGDLERGASYDEAIVITAPALRDGRVSLTDVAGWITKELKAVNFVEIPLAVGVPYINANQVEAKFIVEFPESLTASFEKYLNTPSRMITDIMAMKVKMIKGSYSEGIKVAKAFQFTDRTNATIAWPGSLDDFIITVNNSKTLSAQTFSTLLISPTESVYITALKSDPKRVVMYKVHESTLLNSSKTAIMIGDEALELNPTSQRIYSDLNFMHESAEVLEQQTERVVEETMREVNIKTVMKNFPMMSKITGILIFVLKLFVAGASINNLWAAAKARFQENQINQISVEAKKSQTKLFSKLKNVKVSRVVYDDFQDILRQKTNSAKKVKVKDAVDFYMYYYGLEPDDIDKEHFGDFFGKVDPSWYDRLASRDYMTETREVQTVKSTPQPVILTYPYALEKKGRKDIDPFQATETREVQVVKNTPQPITLMTPYDLEETTKKLMKRPPKPKEHKYFIRGNGVSGRTLPLLETPPVDGPMLRNEACLDPAIRDMVDLTFKHSVDVSREDGKTICHGLMIQGRVGVTVGHVYAKDVDLYVTTYLGVEPIRRKVKVLKHHPRIDLLIFQLSPQQPSYKSIKGLLPSNQGKRLNQILDDRAAVLNIPDLEKGLKTVLNARLVGYKEVLTNGGKFEGVSYTSPVTYLSSTKLTTPINTQQGDCGSAIIVNDATVKEKIIGIHNAANFTTAHGSVLYVELFDDPMICEGLLPEKMQAQVNPLHEIDMREHTREALLGMPVVGIGNLHLHRPTKTMLWTSPLALPESDSYQPSIMDPLDRRNESKEDPFYSSVAKWANPQPVLNEDLLDKCINDIGYWYAMKIHSKNVKTKVLTKTEAINSGKNYNVMPINRASSAGYPWSRFGKKSTFLVNKGSDQEAYYGIDYSKKSGQLLNQSIDFIISTCKNPGKYVPIPFAGWLKDEPLKLKKIYSVNTRSFAGAPFDYTIAYRMYFSTIYGAIHEVRDEMPVQVGINPTSMEWDNMTRRLLSCSDKGFDLDFQSFDSTVPAIIQRKLVGIHNMIARYNDPNWTEEDDIVRRGLHQSLVKPLLVCPTPQITYVLQAPGGQPSGHPGTADDNSLIHLVYLYYSYLTIMIARGHEQLANIFTFKEKIQAIIYGDDGVYMVSPDIQHIFNFSSVATVLKAMGIKCTPAAKGDVIQDIISITDCEFLKRDFIKRGKYWYGALKPLSFAKMLGYCIGPLHHWYADKRVQCGRPADLRATADACLREAAIHGKEFYHKMTTHLLSSFRSINIGYEAPRYEDMVALLELPLPL